MYELVEPFNLHAMQQQCASRPSSHINSTTVSASGILLRMPHTDPWQEFAQRHRRDECITAPITALADFGIFVALEGGIEGLVHLADISWSQPGEIAINQFSVGDTIQVSILTVDAELQRVSLGIKQVDNPYQAFADQYAVGDDIIGRVSEIYARKLLVDLSGGLAGVVYLRNASHSETRFEVGEELDLFVSEVWVRRGWILLGINGPGDDSPSLVIQPKPYSPKPMSISRSQFDD